MSEKDESGSLLVGFIIGGVVGVVAGLLLAPKPGAETRADLADYGEVVRERAEEVAARVSQRMGPTVESVREAVDPVLDRVAKATKRDS